METFFDAANHPVLVQENERRDWDVHDVFVDEFW